MDISSIMKGQKVRVVKSPKYNGRIVGVDGKLRFLVEGDIITLIGPLAIVSYAGDTLVGYECPGIGTAFSDKLGGDLQLIHIEDVGSEDGYEADWLVDSILS